MTRRRYWDTEELAKYMKALAALATLCVALVTSALPALARESYVQDGASLLSAGTVSALNAKIGDLAQQTGKEVVVITVPSLNGDTIQSAAEHAFSTQRVNGALIYIAKAEKKDLVLTGRASRAFFPPGTTTTIHDAMRGYFRSGDFNSGVTTGVGLIINTYRGHLNALPRQHASVPVAQPAYAQQSGGFHMGWFWWLIVIIAIFLIVRAVMRAMMGPRMMPPGYGGQGGPGGPGYGQPGYGQPMGYGGGGFGGGGGFWSGMLGGLGGAFLGNELFGNRGGGNIMGGDQAGMGGVNYNNPDSSGFANDAGQADMSNAGGGDYGDSSGGGFDAGGGGGFDGGGGGGGDSGGGW